MTTEALRGGRELFAFLDAFPKRLQSNAVRAGLRAGAVPIRDQARANVQKRSGKTAKAIKSSSPRVNQDGTVSIKVQLKGEHAFVGIFLEYGVAAHLITPGDSKLSAKVLNRGEKVLSSSFDEETGALRIGENFVSGAIMHPGFAPMPFLRPAFDTRAQEAINAFGARIRSYLGSKASFTAPLLEATGE